jgi:outer membrane protein
MRIFLLAAAAAASSIANAQSLTLQEAIRHAEERNGLIAASRFDVLISESGVREALSRFWPRITPEYRFVDQRNTIGANTSDRFHDLGVLSTWQLLDGGQRQYDVARARNTAQASIFDASDTRRSTIFSVTQSFLEVLRSRELIRVTDAQVARAQITLEATKVQVETGATPAKDILQAEADHANSRVAHITARNAVTFSESELKALIGWEPRELPPLEDPTVGYVPLEIASLDDAIELGLASRPDLLAAKKRLDAQRYGVLTAERQASLDWSVNLAHSLSVEPESGDNRSLVFSLSYPLFDGGEAREILKQTRYGLQAQRALHEQQVRDAISQIESVYHARNQNGERLDASRLALEAARSNFTAASESQKEGAATVFDVTNAQITLVTAETNYVEALYDYYISDAELRLVTGQPLLGEAMN